MLIYADLGAAMRFGTRVRFKSVLAAEIAAQLAWIGLDGGDRVGGFLKTPHGLKSHPMSRSTAQLLQFLKAVAEATSSELPQDESEEMPLGAVIDRMRHVTRPGALVFLVSDFAGFDERAEKALRRLSLHAHVTNIFVYDQLDAMLPTGRQRISDGVESIALGALSRAELEGYARAFEERRDRLERICRTRAMAFHTVATIAADAPQSVIKPHRKAPHRERRIAA
ncbi:MAG: hypothetical protein AcusKO_01950 [Acuticoccus sp.]